jgi:hypothetical protein
LSGSQAIALPTIHQREYAQELLQAGAQAVFRTWTDPKLRQFLQDVIDINRPLSGIQSVQAEAFA